MPGITYYCTVAESGDLVIDSVSCEEDDAWSYEPYEIDKGLFSWSEEGVLFRHEFGRDLDKPIYLRRPPWIRRVVRSADRDRLEHALRMYLSSPAAARHLRVVQVRGLGQLTPDRMNLDQLNRTIAALCKRGIL